MSKINDSDASSESYANTFDEKTVLDVVNSLNWDI